MNLNLNKKTSLLIFSFFLFVILVAGCGPSGPVGPVSTNQTPIITSNQITSATVNQTYTYNVTATDPDGDTLAFSLTISPTGMTINSSSGLISWTPTTSGDYDVMVKVSDNGSPVKSITQSFTIHVGQPGPTNQPPTITSTAITTATVGQAYSYDVNATDPDGDTLVYSLTTTPSGMSINSSTGLITWTPTAAGNYNVTVEVSDGVLFATQSFTITVADSGTYPIGGTGPAGGLIFYDKGSYSNGWRYLEAAPASTEWTDKEWGSFGTLIGGTETGIGSGQSNTTIIVTWLNNNSDDTYEDVTYKTDRAAYLCDALTVGGYSDWFLPSKDELDLMYQNLHNIFTPVGGFTDDVQWSSSEITAGQVWNHGFYYGVVRGGYKVYTYRVRAVRAF